MGKNWPRKQMVGHGCFQWIQNRYLDSSDLIGIYMVCEWQLSVLRRRRYRSTQAAALQYFWTHSWQVNTRELSQCYPYQPWSCCLLRLSDWAIIICGHDLVYVPLHHIPGQIVIHQWIMRYAYSTRPHWPKSSWAVDLRERPISLRVLCGPYGHTFQPSLGCIIRLPNLTWYFMCKPLDSLLKVWAIYTSNYLEPLQRLHPG